LPVADHDGEGFEAAEVGHRAAEHSEGGNERFEKLSP
jgi:hypothetical protein